MRKKTRKIVTVFFAFVVFFFLEFVSTNSLWEKVTVAFKTKQAEYNLDDIGIPSYVFLSDNYNNISRVEFEGRRVFVIHNFFDGYIWASYTRKVYDDKGELLYGSEAKFPRLLRIKIHRERGEWRIADVYDPPY